MNTAVDDIRAALAERYEVERELGRGGMATVFLAVDRKHGRRVAIKILDADLASALGPERFLREIRIAAGLSHPNILPLYDSGEIDGRLYYVMPFVEGESLRDRIKRERQLPIGDALVLAIEIANGLAYAHSRGFIHRDIKPENILLESGHAVLADFGIARAVGGALEGDVQTQSGVSIGTPAYMSPEQAAGERDLDGRSDQYALACVLYEMLVGQPPFTAPTTIALIARHLADPVPPIGTVRDTVSEEIEAVVMRALAKTPADRFATMSDFAQALEMCLGTSEHWPLRSARTPRASRGQIGARSSQRAVGTDGRLPRRRSARLRQLTLFAGLPIVLAFAGLLYWRWGARAAERRPAEGPPPSRIAVVYFDTLGRGAELGPIADGLTESLIDRLSGVAALDVVSRNGVAPFRGAGVDRDSIARALQVGTLVTGTVEEQGDSLRVGVQLIDARSGAPYERASFLHARGDLLAMRDTLADQVARFLRQHIGDEVRLRTLREGTSDPRAWTLVQRAERLRKEADGATRDGDPASAASRLLAADSLLAGAEEIDARWTEPSVLRATVALQRAQLEREPMRASPWLDSGLVRAEHALAAEPRNPAALEARGTLRYYRVRLGLVPLRADADRALADAQQDLRSAVELDPTRATAWNVLSQLDYLQQDPVQSNLHAQRAYEADAYLSAAPAIIWRMWATSYDLEQFANATKWCAEGRRRFPRETRFLRCQLWDMTTKAVTPDIPAAWSLVDELAGLAPADQRELQRRDAQLAVAGALARAGLHDSARAVMLRARASPEIDPRGELMGLEAFVRTLTGVAADRDTAVTLLERFLVTHPEHRAGFGKVNAWWWRDLQKDPRFKALAGTAG